MCRTQAQDLRTADALIELAAIRINADANTKTLRKILVILMSICEGVSTFPSLVKFLARLTHVTVNNKAPRSRIAVVYF